MKDTFKNIIQKHGKLLVIMCILVPLVLIFITLFIVWIFDYTGLQVPGRQEMWLGYMGAILGGMFTLSGVLLTIFWQDEENLEQKRKECMPILGFDVCYDDTKQGDKIDAILTLDDGEIITSSFPNFKKIHVAYVKITTLSNACAFDFVIEDIAINGTVISKGSAFAPAKRRIAIGESTTIAFNYPNETSNLWCVARFSYKDILGNLYYQDLPFTYAERECRKKEKWKIEQNVEIRDVKTPILTKTNIYSFSECLKEYDDYHVFSGGQMPIGINSSCKQESSDKEQRQKIAKRTLNNIDEKEYDFDANLQRAVYCYVFCIRNKNSKSLPKELKFDSYQEWKLNLISKYKSYSIGDLEEFSRHLRHRARNNEPSKISLEVLFPVILSIGLTFFTNSFMELNTTKGVSQLQSVMIVILSVLIWAIGMAIIIWTTIQPIWENHNTAIFFEDYKEVIDEIIEIKKTENA